MSEWIKTVKSSELNRALRIDTEEEPVALFKTGDGIFAVSDNCSHEEASLSEGEILGTTVCCPKHGSGFDILTGNVRGPPAIRPIRAYQVKVVDDTIYIKRRGEEDS